MPSATTTDPKPMQVRLSPTANGGTTRTPGLTQESAAKASALLSRNHADYHLRFNGGFHNHITHHILALWSFGATPEQMQDLYDHNTDYQTSLTKPEYHPIPGLDMSNRANFKKYMGGNERYVDYLRFFEAEIQKRGAHAVAQEYLFSGNAGVYNMGNRIYADLVHPAIHLGCAIEFDDPAIFAQALAGTALHEEWPGDFLDPARTIAAKTPKAASATVLEVMAAMHNDPKVHSAVKDEDGFNKVKEGLLTRVTGAELAPFLARFKVTPTEAGVHASLLDMMYTSVFALGAAQRAGKREMVDFALLHNATLAAFYPAIVRAEWLTIEQKARMLEDKGRVDAVVYASCGSMALYAHRIAAYKPEHPEQGWDDMIRRSVEFRDEGHIVKLMRAFYATYQLGDPPAGFPMTRDDVLTVAHMCIDSLELAVEQSIMPQDLQDKMAADYGRGGARVVENHKRFVFYGGTPKAWDHVPDASAVAKAAA